MANKLLETLQFKLGGPIYDIADKQARAGLATLNGDKTTEGSVQNTVAQGIAEVVADAPESFDTLKEIADWIADHPSDTSAMNTQIQQNKTDIAELKEAQEDYLPLTGGTMTGDIEFVHDVYRSTVNGGEVALNEVDSDTNVTKTTEIKPGSISVLVNEEDGTTTGLTFEDTNLVIKSKDVNILDVESTFLSYHPNGRTGFISLSDSVALIDGGQITTLSHGGLNMSGGPGTATFNPGYIAFNSGSASFNVSGPTMNIKYNNKNVLYTTLSSFEFNTLDSDSNITSTTTINSLGGIFYQRNNGTNQFRLDSSWFYLTYNNNQYVNVDPGRFVIDYSFNTGGKFEITPSVIKISGGTPFTSDRAVADFTDNNELVTKEYVDTTISNSVGSIDDIYLKLTGGTLVGDVVVDAKKITYSGKAIGEAERIRLENNLAQNMELLASHPEIADLLEEDIAEINEKLAKGIEYTETQAEYNGITISKYQGSDKRSTSYSYSQVSFNDYRYSTTYSNNGIYITDYFDMGQSYLNNSVTINPGNIYFENHYDSSDKSKYTYLHWYGDDSGRLYIQSGAASNTYIYLDPKANEIHINGDNNNYAYLKPSQLYMNYSSGSSYGYIRFGNREVSMNFTGGGYLNFNITSSGYNFYLNNEGNYIQMNPNLFRVSSSSNQMLDYSSGNLILRASGYPDNAQLGLYGQVIYKSQIDADDPVNHAYSTLVSHDAIFVETISNLGTSEREGYRTALYNDKIRFYTRNTTTTVTNPINFSEYIEISPAKVGLIEIGQFNNFEIKNKLTFGNESTTHWEGTPLIANATGQGLIVSIPGPEDTDDWKEASTSSYALQDLFLSRSGVLFKYEHDTYEDDESVYGPRTFINPYGLNGTAGRRNSANTDKFYPRITGFELYDEKGNKVVSSTEYDTGWIDLQTLVGTVTTTPQAQLRIKNGIVNLKIDTLNVMGSVDSSNPWLPILEIPVEPKTALLLSGLNNSDSSFIGVVCGQYWEAGSGSSYHAITLPIQYIKDERQFWVMVKGTELEYATDFNIQELYGSISIPL